MDRQERRLLLLYRLLTGKVPVKGADPPTSPQILASACPDDLAAAVVQMLQVDPRHRPTAAQLAQTLRDVLESEEEALARVLAAAPTPPVSAGAVMTGPRKRALRVAAGLAALGVAGWCMHAATRPVSSDLADDPAPALRDPALLASSEAGRPTPSTPTQQPTLLASTAPEPPPPTMLDALDGVGAALRHCSTLAGGLLMVEFTTLEKRDTFDRVAVSGTTHPDLDRCVREATVDLHFQPRHAETFTKEYSP